MADDLSVLLRLGVLVGEPALCPGLDFEGIRLRPVRGQYHLVVRALGRGKPGSGLCHVVGEAGGVLGNQDLGS